mmetsp:Transcript_13830/g.47515  ORF Transcript_13830/g.47515 Transcript_13830/m.47515 type:complete len:131 (-) Transcript_13830:463-855(-)
MRVETVLVDEARALRASHGDFRRSTTHSRRLLVFRRLRCGRGGRGRGQRHGRRCRGRVNSCGRRRRRLLAGAPPRGRARAPRRRTLALAPGAKDLFGNVANIVFVETSCISSERFSVASNDLKNLSFTQI